MGVPKFFRWISERYPLTSQLITPNSIPTFDNLYLDMNGIIHNCSHPPSSENDPHFRITEEQMVLAIFTYIDHLFTLIKPQKVFFMAIDGVAPRAKMNQQRSRRFRTARDAREQREQAARKGEKLPEEKAFDSNCITPGTPFMARLSDHLKYYVRKRISEDAEWRNVKVIFSGHDVPGEGEHKIQEFIRMSKAQPDYNPNTRHCLYGLDADLVMLALLSHDPHFCLLREEVTFGRKVKKTTLANQNMFLLHLSLLREYLDLEFSAVANQISFKYDLERIIDDFILMSIFVGNDFLPHLPGLHINEGALELIWKIYKEILPAMGGYMNEHGTISLPRLQMMLDRLALFEKENFEQEFADVSWYKGKHDKEIAALEKARKRGKLIITKDQQRILKQIQLFVSQHQKRPKVEDKLQFVNTLPTRDRKFIQDLADSLHLLCTWDEVDDYGQPLVTLSFNMEEISEGSADEEDDKEWESEEDPEGSVAIQRVFEKYDKAKVVDNALEDMEESLEDMIDKKMSEWKRQYYKEKLDINWDKPEELHPLIYRYIEGLQWVVHYYYRGVCSWGWFYNYHYAPKISDLKGIADFKFDLQLGKPFLPFQQLMGVLPADSMEHVPLAYRDLMYEDSSSILDFYPKTFSLDMNGKKADWEAVVKIPFIDEERLLRAMASRDHRLTDEERKRNTSGVKATEFEFDASGEETQYPSSLEGFFPALVACRCVAKEFEMPTLKEGMDLVLGLMDGVHLGASALAGFPSLATLPYQGSLGYHGVHVFNQDSRNQSMVITITGKHDKVNTSDVAKRLIGQRAFHSWPYLHEGLVTAVSDDMFKYELQQFGTTTKVISKPHDGFAAIKWKKDSDKIEHHYSKRYGVIIGHVDVVIHISPLKGLKRLDSGALIKDYDMEKELTQALQVLVSHVSFEDERYLEQDAPPIGQDFPVGEKVIFLAAMAYGTAAQVTHTNDKTIDISIAYFPGERRENQVYNRLVESRPAAHYTPSHVLSRRMGLSSLALSRIMSTLMVQLKSGSKTNIGLALKFESKGLKVLGYSRKEDRNWEFSEKAIRLLTEYQAAFPEPFRHLDTRSADIVTAAELCPTAEDPDKVIQDMHKWLKNAGCNDIEPVSLFAEQLEKEAVIKIEEVQNHFLNHKNLDNIKRSTIKGIPRQALLKPSHAIYRLQGQRFRLGDRVTMVQDGGNGGVSLGMRGVVVGLGTRDIDVVWDVAFMGGDTLGGRCSDYRGSTVPFSSCLNLTNPQFAVSTSAEPKTVGQAHAFQPQLGPRPVVAPRNYQAAIPANRPPQILQNPSKQPSAPRGSMQYGNAVKGVRQQPQAAATLTHYDRLHSALLGQAPQAHSQSPVVPRQYPVKMLHVKPVSPTAVHHSLPRHNGHAPAPAVNAGAVPPAHGGAPSGRGGGRGSHRGRGAPRGGGAPPSRGAPRGRGRGRGGANAASTSSAAPAAPAS